MQTKGEEGLLGKWVDRSILAPGPTVAKVGMVAVSLSGFHCQGTGLLLGVKRSVEGGLRKVCVTGFLTIGMAGPWALSLEILGWLKQAVVLPYPLTFP